MKQIHKWVKHNKGLALLSFVVYIVGFAMDYFILHLNYYIIKVNDSYISGVFSAQFTVAVLSCTVIAIIATSLSEKHYGFSFKEILNFDNLQIRFSSFLFIELVNIFVATIYFALDYLNAITFIFAYTVALVAYYGRRVINCILDTQYAYKIILKKIIMCQTVNEIIKMGDCLFSTFLHELKELAGSEKMSNHINLINEYLHKVQCINIEQKANINIYKYAEQIIIAASSILGYKEAIRLLSVLFDGIDDDSISYDKRTALRIPIEKIRFYNDLDLYNSKIPDTIENFEDVTELTTDEQSYLLASYFRNLYSNSIISIQYKNSLMHEFIQSLVDFYYVNKNNYNKVKEDVLFYIIKNIVLIEADEQLFVEIITELFEFNEYSEKESFSRSLTNIFQLLFSYSFKETETLSEDFREKIETLILKTKSTHNTERIDFRYLVKRYKTKIIQTLGTKILNAEDKYQFDYWQRNMKVKSLVWTENTVIETFFYLYILFSSELYFASPFTFIDNWEGLLLNDKYRILTCISNFFHLDSDTKSEQGYIFTDKVNREINILSKWLNYKFDNHKQIVNKLGALINDELVKIVEEKTKKLNEQEIDIDVEQINIKLNELLERDKIQWYNKQLEMSNSSEVLHIHPSIDRKEYNTNDSLANRVKQVFYTYTNDYIIKALPIVTLYFDERGVKSLLKALEVYPTVNARNYTFTNDWGISSSVRETEEFQKLIESNQAIHYINTEHLGVHIYFKKEELVFNINVAEVRKEPLMTLTVEQIDIFTENFKASNGLYNIEGAFVNKSVAMELVKEMYEITYISFEYSKKLTRSSGFAIKFSYKNDDEDVSTEELNN